MNKAIIFCAPSGSGKTTIVKHLLQHNTLLMFSISACTRQKRANETDGVDYYFLSVETFKKKIQNNEFLEYEEVYGGNFYGTLKSEIQRIWSLNKVVVFDVDVEGGLNLKNYFKEKALAVFVKPPGIDILKQRLVERNSETPETLQMRIEKAIHELQYENRFDKVILNDTLDHALQEAEQAVKEFLNQ
ncbi:MAG: guanylate kinase [Bacteroidia bacterium]